MFENHIFLHQKNARICPSPPQSGNKNRLMTNNQQLLKKKSSQNPFFNLNNPNLSGNKQSLHPSLQNPTLRRNFKNK